MKKDNKSIVVEFSDIEIYKYDEVEYVIFSYTTEDLREGSLLYPRDLIKEDLNYYKFLNFVCDVEFDSNNNCYSKAGTTPTLVKINKDKFIKDLFIKNPRHKKELCNSVENDKDREKLRLKIVKTSKELEDVNDDLIDIYNTSETFNKLIGDWSDKKEKKIIKLLEEYYNKYLSKQ